MELIYEIPPLDDLKAKSSLFAMRHIFQAAGPKDYGSYALVMNFIRLVDLAIAEYELGRSSINSFVASTETLAFGKAVRASGHFETCITSIKRAIEHLKALRGYYEAPQTLKDILPRGITVLSGKVEKQISGMRHAVHHLDEHIKDRKISQGQPFAMFMARNALELGEHSILYSDLSSWLRELHQLSTKLAGYWDDTVEEVEIYVYLENEGTDCWRPVKALPIGNDQYQIISANDNPEDEQWQYSKGDVVRCIERILSDELNHLVAIESVEAL